MAMRASEIDESLPPEAFETWFRSLFPRTTGLSFETKDCSDQGKNSEPGKGRSLVACLVVEADLFSRNRRLKLLFNRKSLAYRSGAIYSRELEGVLDVASLSDLPSLLKKAMRVRPLQCPPGTALKLKEEYAGLYEWCEDEQGRRQGPYRSWFNTGLYLMARGQYEDDARTGNWTECSRFEKCVQKDYGRNPMP